MKKEEHGDLEYIKFEEDDDIELFRKTFGLVLFKAKKALYCANYSEGFALKFDVDTRTWSIIDYDTLPNQEEVLNDKDSNLIWKKCPPFEVIDKYKEEKANKKLAYWNELRKTTKRKVIGWTDPCYHPKFGKQTDDKVAALINDIAEHDYFFGGDEIDVVPIFDDETCLDFSSSGWGEIEALANQMGGDYDYSMYKNASFLKPPFRMPEEGLYKK